MPGAGPRPRLGSIANDSSGAPARNIQDEPLPHDLSLGARKGAFPNVETRLRNLWPTHGWAGDGDRYKSGEVRIPPIPSVQLSLSEGRTPGQKIRRFQQHVAKSELPEPDNSR